MSTDKLSGKKLLKGVYG